MTIPVSLVITTYNREQYLRDAIASVLAQSYQNFELLIWDDGSTDGSYEMTCAYARQDPRVRTIAAEHQGHAPSLRAAMADIRGKYVGWLDSDDLLAPTALEETVAVLDALPHVGMIYTNYQVIDEHGKLKGLGQRCQIPYSKERLLLDFMTFHFRLMRHSVYEQVGGVDASFTYAQDYDLCLKISEVTDIYHLKKNLYFYRSHPQSISQAQRVEQIFWSKTVIEHALQRRGMMEDYELNVQIVGQFSLRHRQP